MRGDNIKPPPVKEVLKMKEWKIELVEKIEKKCEELREVSLYEVAKENGYNHIKRQDVLDVVREFKKRNQSHKVVQFEEDKNKSLFTSIIFTDAEYESEEEFLKNN